MNTPRAVAAGLIGTAAMTALLLVEPSIGLPKIAMGQVLGSSLGLASALPSVGPALGWGLHFIIGALLALVYAGLLVSRLSGPPSVRGVLYGLLVFVLAQVVFMPFVGGGSSRVATSSSSSEASSGTSCMADSSAGSTVRYRSRHRPLMGDRPRRPLRRGG